MKRSFINKTLYFTILISIITWSWHYVMAQKPAFKVLAVASADPDHDPMIIKSKVWLERIALENNFEVLVSRDASLINDENLAQYQVFIQLHLAPFDMTPSQQAALQKFIISGKGWVGVHAAGLTGTQFKGPDTPYWMWFEKLMGGIIYSPHPEKQTGTILVEDRTHPVTRNLPPSFRFYDEWYESASFSLAKSSVKVICKSLDVQGALTIKENRS